MVYVYAKKSELQKHIKENITTEEIKETLQDLGMDLKGETEEQDPELKIEITAEKMDMISPVGIARAINYYRGFTKELPKYNIKKGDKKIKVDKSVEDIRPKTVAAIIKNLPMSQEILDSIIEIQEKLHASFGRERKKAAIGIYPLQEIKFPITYKAEKPENIKFQPLESNEEMTGEEIIENHEIGKKYAHLLKDKDMFPIFQDSKNNILSMPPVINSHTTGRVTPTTNDLFIECSGHNLVHLDSILKVIITTLMEFGGEAESIKVSYDDSQYELSLENQIETLNPKYLTSLIGIENPNNLKELLNKVQLDIIKENQNSIEVAIPPYRQDIWNDCDIADDLSRAYGFNNIVPTTPNIISTGETLNHTDTKNQISQTMTSLGFLELYTYMLTSSKLQYDMMKREPKNHISIVDSAEEGINMTRTMILPENLEALRINRKHKYPQKVFECGFIIEEDKTEETGAKDSLVLSATIADTKANLTQIKEIVDTLSTLFKWEFDIKESYKPYLIEGRQGAIYYNNEEIGVFGELHPQILENFDLLVPLCILEINIEKILEKK